MFLHGLHPDCLIELALQFIEILLQIFEGLAHHIIRLFGVGLQFDLEHILKRMGYFVAGKLHFFVLEQEYPEQIAHCVILQLDAVGDCVGDLVALDDLNSILLVAITHAQLQSHVLTHLPRQYIINPCNINWQHFGSPSIIIYSLKY